MTTFPKPETEPEFDNLCTELCKAVWNDPSASFFGRRGQSQFGIDILGSLSENGAQCKHYLKTKFTINVVIKDVKKADAKKLPLKKLEFLTAAEPDSKVALQVLELNRERKAKGFFPVTVKFWRDICLDLKKYPDVAAVFFPTHERSIQSKTHQDTQELLRRVSPIPASTDSFVPERFLQQTQTFLRQQLAGHVGVERMRSKFEFLAKAVPREAFAAQARSAIEKAPPLLVLHAEEGMGKTIALAQLLKSIGSVPVLLSDASEEIWHQDFGVVHEKLLRRFCTGPELELAQQVPLWIAVDGLNEALTIDWRRKLNAALEAFDGRNQHLIVTVRTGFWKSRLEQHV